MKIKVFCKAAESNATLPQCVFEALRVIAKPPRRLSMNNNTSTGAQAAGSALPIKLKPKYSAGRLCLAALIGFIFILKMTTELSFITISLYSSKKLISLMNSTMMVLYLDLAMSSCGLYLFILHGCCDNLGYISAGTSCEAGNVAAMVVLDAICAYFHQYHPMGAARIPCFGVLVALGYVLLRVNDNAILISYIQPTPSVTEGESQAHTSSSTTKHNDEVVFTNPFQPHDPQTVINVMPPTIPHQTAPIFMQPVQVQTDAPPAYLYPIIPGPTAATASFVDSKS